MIIECPSCRTKFSVDTAQVRSVKNARFHCSRCDHFFERAETTVVGTTAVAAVDTKAHKHTEAGPEQLPLLPEKSPPKGKRSGLSSALASEEHQGITADWPDKPSNEVLTADLRHAVSLSMVSKKQPSRTSDNYTKPEEPIKGVAQPIEPPPTEPVAVSSQIDSHSEVLSDDRTPRLEGFADSRQDTQDEQTAPAKSLPTITRSVPNAPDPGLRPWEPAASLPATPELDPVQREVRRPAKRLKLFLPRSVSLLHSPVSHSPVTLVTSFPAALCLFFLLWSVNITSTPLGLKRLLNLDTEILPRIPPPGVQVVDLASSVVTLDDGKQIIQLTGKVLNGTSKAIGEVMLKAALYDSENQEVCSLVSDAANGLMSAARLAALDQNTLERLQRQTAAPDRRLNPSQAEPFKLIFAAPLDRAAWYTTRVYSVRL